MKKDTEILKKLRFFEDIEEQLAEDLIKVGEVKEYDVKEIIFDEYQELTELYVLIDGTVNLGINVPNKGKINLASIHPGQLFSWSAIFPPYISTAYAITTTPVKVLAIKASSLQALIGDNNTFGFRFMKMIGKTLSQRLSDTRFQLVNLITI